MRLLAPKYSLTAIHASMRFVVACFWPKPDDLPACLPACISAGNHRVCWLCIINPAFKQSAPLQTYSSCPSSPPQTPSVALFVSVIN
jgi:hypothetical protein